MDAGQALESGIAGGDSGKGFELLSQEKLLYSPDNQVQFYSGWQPSCLGRWVDLQVPPSPQNLPYHTRRSQTQVGDSTLPTLPLFILYSERGYYSNAENEEACAKIWSIYVGEAERYDVALVESWKADMEGMLIFVRHFFLNLFSI